MKKQSRTLQTKPYKVADEDEWSWVIWGLNGDAQSDWRGAAKRVSSLLLKMKELDEIRERLAPHSSDSDLDITGEFCWPLRAFKRDELEDLNRRGMRLAREVNKQLRFYRWSPGIMTSQFDETFRQHPQWNARSEAEYQEKVAIELILKELSERRINRFRICRQCQRWFYAVAAHQVSCSESCRKKFASKDESFKSKRRRYMAEYRKKERARSAAALAKARKS